MISNIFFLLSLITVIIGIVTISAPLLLVAMGFLIASIVAYTFE